MNPSVLLLPRKEGELATPSATHTNTAGNKNTKGRAKRRLEETGFRRDTWNVGCTLRAVGSFNLVTMGLMMHSKR